MIYETKTQYTIIDHNGNDKVVRERFLILEAMSFADAESQTYLHYNNYTQSDIDVVDIKRSKLREILNSRSNENENIFVADVADIQYNDDGEEVEIVYKVALFALNLDDAYAKLKRHLEQGYSMQAIGVRKTKFVDLIA